jgi:hypothetical protein
MSSNLFFKWFLYYLKKKKIYHKFMINFNDNWQLTWRKECYYPDDLITSVNVFDGSIIAFSFLWEKTNEGRDFWDKYSKEWFNLCENLKLDDRIYNLNKIFKIN